MWGDAKKIFLGGGGGGGGGWSRLAQTPYYSWMSLKFGQIPLLVSMATDRVIIEKNRCCHFFSAVYYPIIFMLAGNDDCMRARRSLNFC